MKKIFFDYEVCIYVQYMYTYFCVVAVPATAAATAAANATRNLKKFELNEIFASFCAQCKKVYNWDQTAQGQAFKSHSK